MSLTSKLSESITSNWFLANVESSLPPLVPSLYPSSVTSTTMPCIFLPSKGPLSTSGIGIMTVLPKEASSKRLLVFLIVSACCWRPLFACILALTIEFTIGVRSGGVLMAGLSVLWLSCSTKLISGGAVLDSMDSFSTLWWTSVTTVIVLVLVSSLSSASLHDSSGSDTRSIKSSSLCSCGMISSGTLLVERPTFGLLPKSASYGDCLIPVWNDLFFENWTNFNPSDHFTVLLSISQAVSIPFISPFARSTLPWLWGCLGLPCTKVSSGQSVFNSVMTSAVNSRPVFIDN